MHIFHSKKDNVLSSLYLMAKMVEGVSLENALGYHGPENKISLLKNRDNIYVVDCRNVVEGHSKYKDRPEIYNHLGQILRNGVNQDTIL